MHWAQLGGGLVAAPQVGGKCWAKLTARALSAGAGGANWHRASELPHSLELEDKLAAAVCLIDGVEDVLHIRLQEEGGGELNDGAEL